MTFAELSRWGVPPEIPGTVVPHPKYGVAPIMGESKLIPQDARPLWWYEKDRVFPTSAILADLSEQVQATVPADFYLDSLETCRDCGRPFLFFALEQKFWYEKLKFSLDSRAVRCPLCRKSDRALRFRFHRYSTAIRKIDLSDAELALLVSDTHFLWEQGLITDIEKVQRVKNLARKRALPGEG